MNNLTLPLTIEVQPTGKTSRRTISFAELNSDGVQIPPAMGADIAVLMLNKKLFPDTTPVLRITIDRAPDRKLEDL